MTYKLAYGSRVQSIDVPEENLLDVLMPNFIEPDLAEEGEILRALREPIGSLPLKQIVHPGEKIVVISSDITRPMPTRRVMPQILDELYADAAPKDITLVFAIGNHRRHTEQERMMLAGDRAWKEILCVDSDPEDCVRMGMTASGTPVDISRIVAEADRRICLGNIEYHYFAGYSGGAKAIMPGISTREAIQRNHSMMADPAAVAGRLKGNPIREDIEEAGRICGIDFIFNVVLDDHKRIIRAVAGHPVLAHREGCRVLDEMYGKNIEKKADIVVVSPGGMPKDINLYQAQKALDNAKHAVNKGGIIILVGACNEGLGEKVFEKWITEAASPKELIERIKIDFQLGGHKAAAIAMVLEEVSVFLVSEMEHELVKRIFFEPFKDAQQALDVAFARLGKEATVMLMPFGGSTLPLIK